MKDKILKVSVAEDKTSCFNKSVYLDDVYEVVEKVFKIDPATEIGVIQKKDRMSKSWNIAVKDVNIHEKKNMDKHVGEIYKLSSGCVVNVSRSYEVFTDVVVKFVPPYWTPQTIERIFQSYGRVNSLQQEEFRYGYKDCKAAYRGVWDGNWKISILINTPIPSTLKIDGERIEVHYRGQPKTCFNCGDNHFFYEGKCGRTHFNRFNMDDFPQLIPREVKDVNLVAQPDDVNENSEEMEKSDETHAAQEPDENMEEIEAPQASKESNELEKEKQEPIVKETSESEDMNKIEEAPLEETPQKPKVPIEIAVESQENSEKEENVISADVMHRNDSQEVKGALPSPKAIDSIDEFISSVTLDDGTKLIQSDSDIYDFMVAEKSPEHTDTGITDTASDVADLIDCTGSPPLSLDSRPTPGQRTEGKSPKMDSPNMDLMDLEITQMMATQSGNIVTPLEESLPPPMPPDSGIKRGRIATLTTEEDSDYGMVKDSEKDANSHCSKYRKKLREENGKQQEEDSDEQS